MIPPASSALPAALFAFLAATDIFVLVARRTGFLDAWWAPYVGWICRPLAALAAWNALYRIHPASFKFNELTFPLYANLWSQGSADPSGQLPRTIMAVVAAAAVLFTLRQALRHARPGILRLLFLWGAVVALQLVIALAPRGWQGVVLPWTAEGKVYAFAARQVDTAGGAGSFLRDYDRIQPVQPVHARSHPPGATLLSRWTQKWENPGVRQNILRLLLMASLNLPLVYLFGRRVLSPRGALSAAVLFGVMPASIAYGTYSQDTVYALFFGLYLLLSWELGRRDRAPAVALAAGTVLYLLSMLTFSWSIAAGAAFLFVLSTRLDRGASLSGSALHLALPPLVLLFLHGITWAIFRFSYYASYRESYSFHTRYYPFADLREWIVALVGGQLELLWAMGPLVASAALVALGRRFHSRRREPFSLLLWSVLLCYGTAVIFGPNPLKLETARCWFWILPLPIMAAADYLDRASPGDDRPILLAAGASTAASLFFFTFLNFGA